MAAITEPLVILSERLGEVTGQERRIEQHPAVLRRAPLWTRPEIHRHAAGATVLIAGAVEPLDAGALAGLPACQAIVRRGVGYDNVDLAAATRLGIVVANVPDASVGEVSDHALSLLLAVERRLVGLDRVVRAGGWQRDPQAIRDTRRGARRLASLTLGVVGFGRIGQALAGKGRGLYRRILAADPVVPAHRAAELGVTLVGLEQLLAAADHVSLHVPGGPGNQHLIGAAELAAMRPDAVLVNTARGGVVDEAALLAALAAGRLAGAGLDTTATEPLGPDSPLLATGPPATGPPATDRLVLTAHSAAWSTTAAGELVARSVDAVLAVLSGRRPESVVNPDVLTSPALRATALRTAAATTGGAGD